MPSVGGSDARVFSLVYGNGIYDEDILAKFDTLLRAVDTAPAGPGR